MPVSRDAKAPTTRPADVERKAEIVRVLVEVGNAADAVAAQVLSEFGVPASVAGTLWALAPGTEPPTMRDVAARLHCDPSTVLSAHHVPGGRRRRWPSGPAAARAAVAQVLSQCPDVQVMAVGIDGQMHGVVLVRAMSL